jgi:type II secretory pathway component PulF
MNDYAEFFKQLSLLTRSKLPLPEALRHLAGDCGGKKYAAMVNRLSDGVNKGNTLSATMAAEPEVFSPLAVRMVKMGETDGTLPEVLDELYKLSRVRFSLIAMMRDIMLYPAITMSMALFLFLGAMLFIVPDFKTIFEEMFGDWHPVPLVTRMAINCSDFVNGHMLGVGIGFAVLMTALIILFCNTHGSNRLILWLSQRIPYSETVFYNSSMSRFCSIWSSLIHRKIPDAHALRSIAGIIDFPPLAMALERATVEVEKGRTVKEAIAAESVISRLLVLTMDNCGEGDLSSELASLADIYRERSAYGFRKMSMALELMTFIGMVAVCGIFIISLFAPFVSIVSQFC